jgi:hypothetical protein
MTALEDQQAMAAGPVLDMPIDPATGQAMKVGVGGATP